MTQNLQTDGVPELTLGWRIQMALSAGDLKQTDLMDHFELSRGTISRWCRDDGVPPKRYQIQQIALMTGVNAQWLETGIAPTNDGGGQSAPSRARTGDLRIISPTIVAFPLREAVAA